VQQGQTGDRPDRGPRAGPRRRAAAPPWSVMAGFGSASL